MGDHQMCFECLQRRIQADYSEKLIFAYGLSDFGLPFGSSAVVQMPNSGGEEPTQFLLVYTPRRKGHCLTNYVDGYCREHFEGNHGNGRNNASLLITDLDEAEARIGVIDDKNTLETNSNESQFSLNDGRESYLFGTRCKTPSCKTFSRFSCLRTISALAPISHVGISSYAAFEALSSNFLSGSMEDHILCALDSLILGKPAVRDSINFLSLVGIPSFDENPVPGCIRHPNIVPILGMLKTSIHTSFVLPSTPYTMESILRYSPGAIKSDWHIRFLIYQLLSALAHMHGLGVAHGNICLSNMMLTDSGWCWLRIGDNPSWMSNMSSNRKEFVTASPSKMTCCIKDCPSHGLDADLRLSQSLDWHSCFHSWRRGELSNFEYLLFLNRLAGRRWGDHTFHTVIPWVIDFSVKPDENNDVGWRDLSKSKWRLAKGDEQLDFTYSTSEIPHHVSDECLSELAVCSYKARRLPLSVLRMAVRSVYEPNEYPSTMQRLYQWTPDECIPEFFCDPQIFYSLHSGMSDLAVPSWSNTPEEFIKLHRDALESDWVSGKIHHWIDITFGYKLSGQAAVLAKNVMLPASTPAKPKSIGRRQLFTQPHPARRGATSKRTKESFHNNEVRGKEPLLPAVTHLLELEEVAVFCEHARHLSPLYSCHAKNVPVHDYSREPLGENLGKTNLGTPDCDNKCEMPPIIDLNYLLENIELDIESSMGYQKLLLWKQKSACSRIYSEDVAEDIFSVGCILAELHLRKPLFDQMSLSAYLENGVLPRLMQELPPHSKVLVEACIQKDWWRRPSAKCILESPYFPSTVRSAYLFVTPLQILAKNESRLRYAANFAEKGALKAMEMFAAEMCAPYCLPLVVTPLSDTEAKWAYILLKELLNCLSPKAVKALVLPTLQKILQATGYSHLKVSLLQGSFVQDIWSRLGKQTYLASIHPLVLSNLYLAPHKSSAAAASVLLIGSSEELGVPITVCQTILPLIHSFGKGLCSDGIDVVVRIGNLFGENFVVKQILPLLRNIVHSCINVSHVNKSEPMQSWSALALLDCLMTLDGLVALLSKDILVKELIEGQSCLYIQILMQVNLGNTVLQAAAASLLVLCQQIGSDFTALHVLPKLKELFDELAFSQETANSSLGSLKVSKTRADDVDTESHMDLVLLLYPPFASLLGIEKLRQCCATWLLHEQFLLRRHKWKWKHTKESSRSGVEMTNARKPTSSRSSASESSPAKMLLNGVGWSIPQSQGSRGTRNLKPHRRSNENHQKTVERQTTSSSFGNHEPWDWFPCTAATCDGPDFLGRIGGAKDESPWKIRASVIQSIRAHHGALRSFFLCQDECTVFTAGVGLGFKGTILKWDLSRIECISGYYGHEEVVNDICVLASPERVASCDGTIHVWNSLTGKLISVFAEFSANSSNLASSLASASKINSDQESMLNFNLPSSGIMTNAFDGSLYTSMHHLDFADMLVAGTGNGSLRFIDVVRGQKLHMWRSESVESSFPSLISSICSCGSGKTQADGTTSFPSWIAAGLSSGMCRLLDVRSGNIIASWQAHDGYVTKLAAAEDHLLVSSSLDKTLRIWDLRRNWTSHPVIFKGHSDGLSGFSVWGQDVISIFRNKIGLSSLSTLADDEGQHRVTPRYLYMADSEVKNMSLLSSIIILPFSRLFLVGTEDGYMKICC